MNGLGNVIRGPVIMTPLITDNYCSYRTHGVISIGSSRAVEKEREYSRMSESLARIYREERIAPVARIDYRKRNRKEIDNTFSNVGRFLLGFNRGSFQHYKSQVYNSYTCARRLLTL